MVSDYISHYKPTKRAWLAVCVVALVVAAIVYVVFASDWQAKVNSVLQLEVKNGAGAMDVNIIQVQPKTKGRSI